MNDSKFSYAVSQLTRAHDEAAFRLVVEAAGNNDITPSDVAHLATILANSGERLSFPEFPVIADIPSTGGPSSLSTLLCPLYLVAYGSKVVKLGVPGRPAGGIDVLAQIPGYKTTIDRKSIEHIVRLSSYVHFLAGPSFTPVDLRLFRYRQKVGAQGVAVLVAASLLSKKLAAGISHVGLDIRVFPGGNFGVTWDEARANARLFNASAMELGIKSVCFLTDGELPYQGHVGRRESLLAVHRLLCGSDDDALKSHNAECSKMACITTEASIDCHISRNNLREIFFENLASQGSSQSAFVDLATRTEKQHRQDIVMDREGLLDYSVASLRDLIVRYQQKEVTPENAFPDPCGLILRHYPGDPVRRGDSVTSYRTAPHIADQFAKDLRKLFIIGPCQRKRMPMEVVSDA